MCNSGQSDAHLTDGSDDNALKIHILLPVGLTLGLLWNVKVLNLGFVVSTDHSGWVKLEIKIVRYFCGHTTLGWDHRDINIMLH